MNAIEISGVSFAYPSTVVHLPNMQIAKGERVFVQGKSGSGKSTMLNLLAGIHVTQEGTVFVQEKNLANMKASQRDRFRADNIGYIFQQFNLIEYLSVYENIELTAKMSKSRASHGTVQEEIEKLAEKLEITSILKKRANEISVGQAQRTACARALLGKPKIILADEPTSSLDSDSKDNFLQLLFASLEDFSTLVFVSHDKSLEKRFDRSIELNAGGIT